MVDSYEDGSLNDEQIGEALNSPYKAYDLFDRCWGWDKYETGAMVQQELERFKKHLALRLKRKNEKGTSGVG